MEQLPNLSNLSHEQKDQLIYMLWEQVRVLTAKVKELEDRLSKNSGNSNKPPSSDGFNKPKPQSRRHKNKKKKVGGQKGHQGTTLKRSANPDKVESHDPEQCWLCAATLLEEERLDYEGRQVFDLPPLNLEVTEHRAYKKSCGCCGVITKGNFPSEVVQTVQYGPKIKALMVYMNEYQLLPFERSREFFQDVFNQAVSVGTIFRAIKQSYHHLESAELHIQQELLKSPVLHADETGLRLNKVIYWLHVASTHKLTFYGYHKKRGQDAMQAIGLLPKYQGTLVHDHLKSYFHYGGSNALCNAHHLRELTFITERYKHQWSEKMERLLINIKKAVEAYYEKSGEVLPEKRRKRYQSMYMNLLSRAREECPHNTEKKGRGKIKQTKAWNLLNRLRQFNQSVLAFMYNPLIPFDNNQAERDLRMVKVQQKISGCFRSEEGLQYYCRIRGYISTAKKQGHSVLVALQAAIQNQPVMFSL
jgi:transposase